MPNYLVKARNTSVITEVPVTADSREGAIMEVAKTAKPGEQMEVMSCVEVVGDAATPAAHGKHVEEPAHHGKK